MNNKKGERFYAGFDLVLTSWTALLMFFTTTTTKYLNHRGSRVNQKSFQKFQVSCIRGVFIKVKASLAGNKQVHSRVHNSMPQSPTRSITWHRNITNGGTDEMQPCPRTKRSQITRFSQGQYVSLAGKVLIFYWLITQLSLAGYIHCLL